MAHYPIRTGGHRIPDFTRTSRDRKTQKGGQMRGKLFERRKISVHDLPHWYDRPEIDREALRRLAVKDRARAISGAHDTFVAQPVVVSKES